MRPLWKGTFHDRAKRASERPREDADIRTFTRTFIGKKNVMRDTF